MSDTMITVIGNLTHDPVIREVPGGRYVTTLRMAANDFRRDADDKWVPVRTTYYTVKAWNGLGANAAESFRKGDRVIVHGRIEPNEWTDSEGKPRITLEIDAKHLGHEVTFYNVRRVAHTVALAPEGAAAVDASAADQPEGDDDGVDYTPVPELSAAF